MKAETAEAKRLLRDVETRHAELARVEAALTEVRDLFQQLAHLVAMQQDRVDSVEYYALQATEHVGTGGDHLLKGTVSKTKARKVRGYFKYFSRDILHRSPYHLLCRGQTIISLLDG